MVSRQFFVFKDLILKGHNCNTFQYLVTMSPALQRVLVTLRRHTRAFSGGVAGKRLLFSDTREIYVPDGWRTGWIGTLCRRYKNKIWLWTAVNHFRKGIL